MQNSTSTQGAPRRKPSKKDKQKDFFSMYAAKEINKWLDEVFGGALGNLSFCDSAPLGEYHFKLTELKKFVRRSEKMIYKE